MAQFQAFNPNVQVAGRTVKTMFETIGLAQRLAQEIFDRNGIHAIVDGKWYPQQIYLNVYREIYQTIGPKTLKMIGKRISQKSFWPINVNNVERALAALDIIFHMSHRGGEIGHYKFEKNGKSSAKITCQNPYPCEFDLGFLEATVEKFKAHGRYAYVKHDYSRSCRANGGESCTYFVTW